jgi:hypothetical protein
MKITKTKLRQLVREQAELSQNKDAPMQMSMNELEDALWTAATAVASGKSPADAVAEALAFADQPYDIDEDEFNHIGEDGGAWEDDDDEYERDFIT